MMASNRGRLLPKLVAVLITLLTGCAAVAGWLRTPWGQSWYWTRAIRHGHAHDHAEAQKELLRLHRHQPQVFASLLREENPATRWTALDALGQIGPSNLIQHIEQGLRDYDSEVRMRAVELMGEQPQPAYVPLLHSLLSDSDELIRQEATRALSKQTSRAAMSALVFALDDDNLDVAGTAAQALRKVAKKNFGFRFNASPAEKRKAIEATRAWARDASVREAQGFVAAAPKPLPGKTLAASAPDFRAELIAAKGDKSSIALADLKGKAAIVNFWAVWCPTCIPELEDLARLQRRYEKDLRVLAVSVDGGVHPASKAGEPLARFLATHSAPPPRVPPLVGFANNAMREAFGDVHEVPVSVIIDRDGQIRRRYSGARSYEVFDADVKRLLNEEGGHS